MYLVTLYLRSGQTVQVCDVKEFKYGKDDKTGAITGYEFEFPEDTRQVITVILPSEIIGIIVERQ